MGKHELGINRENMDRKVTEICLIAPTWELKEQSAGVVKKYNKDISIFQASLSDACEVVGELIATGAQVFISRKGTKKSIEEMYNIQVVEIGLSLGDYIPIMEEAIQVKGKVAFFSYGNIPEDVRAMCILLKIDAIYYSFYTLEDCRRIVSEAIAAGAILGIGGADTAIYANKEGFRHLVVENSEESLLRAIAMAEQLLKLKKEENEKQQQLKIRIERYETIFNYTHDAIIAVDEKGMIDVLNRGAEKIIQPGKRPFVGKRIDDLIPNTRITEIIASGKKELNQLMNISGTLVSTNRLPIIVDGEVKGAVATFQDIKTIQDSEQKIRVKLHEKGLVAKYHFEDIIGNSEEIKGLIRMTAKFAKSDATVLIQGETGTGKELFAQSIHNAGLRSSGPFVAVNCGSLPRDILEAELFGYEEGTFTGAIKGGKMGLFEMAHRGTIFLDEIGEMPLETQVQLLRVLQEKEIRRLGSDRVTPVDIRVITATNRDLYTEIKENKFREDLFYRLNVLNIEIPPLRERKADIVPIGLNIFKTFNEKIYEIHEVFVEALLRRLQYYAWPGNVREVRNLMERVCVLLSQGEDYNFVEMYISKYLNPPMKQNGVPKEVPNTEKIVAETLPTEKRNEENLEEWEKREMIEALKNHKLDMQKTAEALHISRSTLWRKIKKYGIQI
ncbi:MAG: sigma 54-interacting transcriptional regulator [Clostridium sp.]